MRFTPRPTIISASLSSIILSLETSTSPVASIHEVVHKITADQTLVQRLNGLFALADIEHFEAVSAHRSRPRG